MTSTTSSRRAARPAHRPRDDHQHQGQELPHAAAHRLSAVRTALLEQAVGGFDEENLALLDVLRERRLELFPDERRIVMDVAAERQGDRVHVMAASTFL